MASSSVEEIGSKRRLRGRLCVREFVHDPSDGRSGGVLVHFLCVGGAGGVGGGGGAGRGGLPRGRVGPGGVAGVVEEGRVLSSCLLMRKGRTGCAAARDKS